MVGYLTGCGGDDEKTTMRARAPPAEPQNPPRAAWVSRRRHAPRERWKTTSRRPTQNLNPTARGARGGVASARSAPRRERHVHHPPGDARVRAGARQRAHPLEGNRWQDAARRNHRVSRDTMAIPVVERGQKCERGRRIQPSRSSQHQHPRVRSLCDRRRHRHVLFRP